MLPSRRDAEVVQRKVDVLPLGSVDDEWAAQRVVVGRVEDGRA